MPPGLKFTFTATPTGNNEAMCVLTTEDVIMSCLCAWDARLTVLAVWLRRFHA